MTADILTASRSEKEAQAAEHGAGVDRALAAFVIAYRAIFNAAAGGNVTCRNALYDIEAIVHPKKGQGT